MPVSYYFGTLRCYMPICKLKAPVMKLESIIVPITDQQLDGKLYCFYIVQYFDLDRVTAESMSVIYLSV